MDAPAHVADAVSASAHVVDASAHVVENLFIFMLASFVGLELIRGVSRLLHTPLMSLTNAISSIAIVGAILVTGRMNDPVTIALGALAIACSSINAIGGFMITDRILKMFRSGKGE